MNSKLNSSLRVALALSTTLFVAGCFKLSEENVAVRPQLPELPAKLQAPCYEPGVAQEAIPALTDTRVAWAVCRKKHADIVAFYKDVREGFQ